MDNYEFINLVFENITVYVLCVVFTGLIIFSLKAVRKKSALDPLYYNAIYFIFATSTPLFLWVEEKIDFHFVLYFYVLSIAGFYLFMSFNRGAMNEKIIVKKSDKIHFYFAFLFYFGLTGFSYYKFGIPLFSENRIGLYTDSGGYGFISRINPYLFTILLFFSLERIFRNKHVMCIKNYLYYVTILLLAITGVMSGSRSWVINMMIGLYLYFLFFQGKEIYLNKKLALFAVFFVLIMFYRGDAANLNTSVIALVTRVFMNGDSYFMALPNDVFREISSGSSLRHLFSVFFVPLRIISSTAELDPMGVTLAKYHYPSLEGFFGPNSTPSVYSYFLFQDYGFIFIFLNFLIGGLLAFRISKTFPKTFMGMVIRSKFYLIGISFLADTSYALSALFDFIFFLFWWCSLEFIILILKYRTRNSAYSFANGSSESSLPIHRS